VKAALADSGAAAFSSRRLNTLSGGEIQKAFLALALAQETEILLLDEPASALDPAAEIELFSLLDNLQQKRSLTVIFVSHNLNCALRRSDFVIGLKSGRVLFHATPENVERQIAELYDLPENLFSRADDGKLCLL
jgi:iron complex transport system ATP-binding protein